jgi:hypothetical protein
MNQPAKIDQDERTSALGLFHYARSYWHSGEALAVAKVNVTHPQAPMSFLFYHAIELYLKAYLRGVGKTVNDLRKISHNVIGLSDAAKEDGLAIADDVMETLRIMDGDDNVMRSRYITTGSFTAASEDALSRSCKFLDGLVGAELSKRGLPIRLSEPIVSKVAESDHLADIESDLDSLSRKEREIISYLLHHNLRLFTADADGGYASTLLARDIIRVALRQGQVYSPSDVPMEVPRPIWALLQKHRERFPYSGNGHDPDPWRVGIYDRI